jgi:hypothetical protein
MSYRRSDDPNFTGRFHDKLVGVFGEDNVFRDNDSLAAARVADVITENSISRRGRGAHRSYAGRSARLAD